MSKDDLTAYLAYIGIVIAILIAYYLANAETASAQMTRDTFFVTIHSGLQWGSIECHTEHPFTAERPMSWNSSDGLVEVGNADGLRNPLMLIMEVDAMTLQLVYEHLGDEFLVGFQCPEYVTETIVEDDIEYDVVIKDVHMRSPMWGNLNDGLHNVSYLNRSKLRDKLDVHRAFCVIVEGKD